MNMPPTVSREEWETAREELLVKEKELTHARDALAAERRRMPRLAVEKDYAFEGPEAQRPCSTSSRAAASSSSTGSSSSRASTAGPRAGAPAARGSPTRPPTPLT